MSRTIHCGECDKFAYEDTDGYDFCLKTNEECRCSDKCHLTKWEAMTHYRQRDKELSNITNI